MLRCHPSNTAHKVTTLSTFSVSWIQTSSFNIEPHLSCHKAFQSETTFLWVLPSFVSSYNHIKTDVGAAAAFLNILSSSTMDPFPAFKYWWTFSAGSATDGCRPGRKAPEQMFAAGPGEDEARPVHHPAVHCGQENSSGSSYFCLSELYFN